MHLNIIELTNTKWTAKWFSLIHTALKLAKRKKSTLILQNMFDCIVLSYIARYFCFIKMGVFFNSKFNIFLQSQIAVETFGTYWFNEL